MMKLTMIVLLFSLMILFPHGQYNMNTLPPAESSRNVPPSHWSPRLHHNSAQSFFQTRQYGEVVQPYRVFSKASSSRLLPLSESCPFELVDLMLHIPLLGSAPPYLQRSPPRQPPQ